MKPASSDAIPILMRLKGTKEPSHVINEQITKMLGVYEHKPWAHDTEAALELSEILIGDCEVYQTPLVMVGEKFLITRIVRGDQSHEAMKVTKEPAHGICVAVLEIFSRKLFEKSNTCKKNEEKCEKDENGC